MDNKPPDTIDKVAPVQNKPSLFNSRPEKVVLFIGTLIVAMIIAGYFYDANNNNNGEVWEFWQLSILLFPGGIPIWFPIGLVGDNASFAHALVANSWLVIWALYIGIMVVGIASKSSRLSRALFLVFVFLLLINIRGCATLPPIEWF